MLPKDPIMLLSYINTQLRDYYPSLHDLCKSFQLQEKELKEKLKAVGYEYNMDINQFI